MKKKVFTILAICIILAVLKKIDKSDEVIGVDNSVMTKEFVGTYSCETNPNCFVSAYPRGGNIFRYYDAQIDVYIDGKFEKCSENEYSLTGNGIESQNIIIENQRFSLYVGDVSLDFKKISQIPAFSTRIEELEK